MAIKMETVLDFANAVSTKGSRSVPEFLLDFISSEGRRLLSTVTFDSSGSVHQAERSVTDFGPCSRPEITVATDSELLTPARALPQLFVDVSAAVLLMVQSWSKEIDRVVGKSSAENGGVR